MDESFEQLYQAEYSRVFGYLLRNTQNWHVAEDLAAEVFLAAWAKRDSWGDRGIPRHHWLLRTAHWQYNLYWKKEKRWQKRIAYSPYLDQHEQDGALAAPDDVLSKCHTAMSYALLEAALLSLRPRQAQAVALRYGRGLMEKEAARQMGLGYETYHGLLRNALGRLSDLLIGKPKRQSRHRDDPTIPATCQEPDCDRPHFAHDKCAMHWKRDWRRKRRERALNHDRRDEA